MIDVAMGAALTLGSPRGKALKRNSRAEGSERALASPNFSMEGQGVTLSVLHLTRRQ